MEKLKSAVKLSKEVAENVEAALFKSCKLNLNSPRYKMWTKIFIENVTDCRNKVLDYVCSNQGFVKKACCIFDFSISLIVF